MEGRLKASLAIAFILIALASAAFGQAVTTNRLRLTVTDEQDHAVTGAKCTLSIKAKAVVEAQTGPDGIAVPTRMTGSPRYSEGRRR